ncbi:hypothetical protein HMH01_14385 [Halovulum dunhuangense]|uniref:Uncharacterized protein n=1 Tax=Halovulum dunhuangense TaxID=1505036 RepID=A0A849L5G7_9RHOB|nr:hypothetical protein [Halovulum dunhuangense]
MSPRRAFSFGVNLGLGLIGGTLAWASFSWLAMLEPSLSTFLAILTVGGGIGALVTLGLGSLRNILLRDA